MAYEFVARNGIIALDNSIITGSLNVTGGITGSLEGTASFAQTASYADNFTVAGTITAQKLIVQTVSSSIVYSSGSNIFGNSLSNTQTLTGSVNVTGSLSVNNSTVILSNQTSSMSVANAASVPYSGLTGTVPTWNQNTTGNAANVTGIVAIANGGTGASTSANAITNLGATTVGGNLFTLVNPSAITFPRINANNTVSALSAADFRTAIGAGTSSTTGTVTSVGGTGTVSGLTLSGTVTSTGNLTLGGTLSLTSENVTTALGFTPYNATNPSSYITTAGARTALSFTAGSGAYNNTTGVITIPTNTNQLTNGAGYTTNTGTVTSVGGTGTVSGLTLSGTVTSTGNLTLGGTLSLTSGNVTTALGYTPYNATNPNGYTTNTGTVTSVATSGGYGGLTLSGGTITTSGTITLGGTPTGTWPISVSGTAATATSLGGYGNQTVYTILSPSGNLNGPVWKIRYDTGTVNRYADFGFIDGNGSYSSPFTLYNSAIQANVIYDKDNTAYYIDPASTSNLVGLTVANTISGNISGNADTVDGYHADAFYRNIGFEGGGSNANTLAESRSAFTYANNAPYSGPILYVGASGYGLQLNATYQSGNDIAFRTRNGDISTFNPWRTIVHSGNIGSQSVSYASSAGSVPFDGISAKTGGTGAYSTSGDFRAPIFYDLNNTGFYIDAASTSNINELTMSGNVTYSNGRKGLVGVYDPAQTQAIFAMGAAYVLTNGGASNNIGNLYGLAWSYNPNYGGSGNNPQSISGLNHQLLLMQNGVTTAAMGSGIWTNGTVYGTTFYDTNNTAYYLDPASSSVVNNLYFGTSTNGTYLSGASTWGIRVQNNDGYIWLGPANTGTAHIYTDRPSFYMNAPLIINGGTTLYQGDARASIFYDVDDTTYYANLNSTSDAALRIRGGAIHGPNPTWGAYLLVGGDGRQNYINTSYASVCASNGNLHIDAGSGFQTYINYYDGDIIYFGGGANNIVGQITSSGTLTVSGDVIAYGSPSDISLKENIKPLEYSLNKILKLQGVSFDWKEDTDTNKLTQIKEDIGFIAQEVQEIIPELVRKNDNGLLSLRDKGITALLVEAIKEQQQQINKLTELINNLTK